MPTVILESDAFADTIYYTEGEIADETVTYHHAFRKCPALAMMAAKVYDLATTAVLIEPGHLCVLIHNGPDDVGFQLLIADAASEDEIEAYNHFGTELEKTAEKTDDVMTEENAYIYRAKTEQALLNFLVAFARDTGLDFNAKEIDEVFDGDLNNFHACESGSDAPTWEAAAERALQKPWVMATLPTRIFTARDELLREAYRIRYLGFYTQEQIQQAIDATDAPSTAARMTNWTLAYH